MSTRSAPEATPKPAVGKVQKNPDKPTHDPRRVFFVTVLDMSWQLAVVVLVPIIGGVELDKSFSTNNLFTFIGLGLAIIGSGVVMWRAMQAANRLPVPKLTAAQKKAVRKSYEDEDDE